MEIKIDPNCTFPEDMTQEELDSMLEEFKEMIEKGTLEENSRELTVEEYESLEKERFFEETKVTKH